MPPTRTKTENIKVLPSPIKEILLFQYINFPVHKRKLNETFTKEG